LAAERCPTKFAYKLIAATQRTLLDQSSSVGMRRSAHTPERA
jgi:hypothetical protein